MLEDSGQLQISLGHIPIPSGYVALKRLSSRSSALPNVLLSRERATERLVVLKSYTAERTPEFRREAKALAALSDCEWTPKLHFAVEEAHGSWLAIEYFQAQSLSLQALDLAQRTHLANRLRDAVQELHQLGWAHGDLSPGNVLVRPAGDTVRFKLIDWEFSERCAMQTTASYDRYRGTVGFSGWSSDLDLQERDRAALAKLYEFIGALPAERPRAGSRKLWSWFR